MKKFLREIPFISLIILCILFGLIYNPNERPAVVLEPNEDLSLALGWEVVYNGLTKQELVNKLNKNLYDTLEGSGEYFADYAIKTGLDPYLAVSIVNVETGCKWKCSYLVNHNYNIGGLRGNGGYLKFNSLEEGINEYLDILYYNYWKKGLITSELMNHKYAENPNWHLDVDKYYKAIENS